MSVRAAGPRTITELEIPLSDSAGDAGGGGPAVPVEPPVDPPRTVSELEPDRPTPASAARLFTYFAMFWIVALFGTMAVVLETRWAHAANRLAIPLPPALYASTVLLLAGSVSMEFARRSPGASHRRRRARAVVATGLLGAGFLASQTMAWQEFGLENPRVASNPGSFFFYLITGAHASLLLVGLAFLVFIGVSPGRGATTLRHQSALGTLTLYWQFLGALWLALLTLLITAIR